MLNLPEERYRWAALGVVMIGTFMAVLDSSIVNVALPSMMAGFGVSVEQIRWVVTLYMLTFAIVTLATGALRGRIGLKRLYLLSLAVFTAASLLCAAAWDLRSLSVFRVLQALGGGVLFPAALIVISECFPPERRGAAFGTFGVVIVFAPTLGPTLGGYLVEYLSWRWIFTINIPVGLAALVAAAAVLRPGAGERGRGFDWGGFAGLAAMLGGLLLALTRARVDGWGSPRVLGSLAAAAAGGGVFLAFARRVQRPIVELSLFANRTFALVCGVNAARAVGLYGRIFLIPLFVVNVLGLSPVAAGWVIAPAALVAGGSSPIWGQVADRRGPRPLIVAGFGFVTASMLAYARLTTASGFADLLWPQLLFGLGMGMMNASLTSAAMNAVRREQLGMVSGLLSVIMQVGGAFAVALLASFLAAREQSRGPDPESMALAFGESYLLLTAVAACGLLLGLALSPRTGSGGASGAVKPR